jgi:hypothetical protein
MDEEDLKQHGVLSWLMSAPHPYGRPAMATVNQ